VIVPTPGAKGTSGCASISTGDVDPDVQPSAFVTVNVYDPAVRPVTVYDVPEPVVVPPGVRVIVHIPVPGRPFRTTLPVADVQLG